MEYHNPKHLISKFFYCPVCTQNFKKLVLFNTIKTTCPKCDKLDCNEICNIKTQSSSQQKSDLLRQKLLNKVAPFSVSPFSHSIERSHLDFSTILEDDIITTPKNDFFIDNFNSNFISNFKNPMSRIVFIQTQKKSGDTSQPLNKNFHHKLRHVKINKNFCKIRGDKCEMPNCFLCLKDIFIGDDAILLRCGHLFHKNCILEWLESHSVCSICKFDAVRKNEHKSSIDKVFEKEIEEFKEVKKNSSQLFENEMKYNNLYGSNINILGESAVII